MNDVPALDPVVLDELLSDERTMYFHTHPPREWVERVGPERVRTCPISEAAMVGIGVGAAMAGMRPLVDVNRASFLLCAMDQICNHAAKVHYLSGGQYPVPLTITCAMRGDYHVDVGREHAPYGMFVNVPGLTVVVPGSLADAIDLLRASMRHDGPVLFFMSPLLDGEPVAPAGVAPAAALGRARVVAEGEDATIVAIGAAALVARRAVTELSRRGVCAELIDPRTLAPLDTGTIRRSVRKTGRLVVVEEASGGATAGLGITGQVVSDPVTFARLLAPPVVLGGQPAPMPASVELERTRFPTVEMLVDKVHAVVGGSRSGRRQP